MVHDRLQWSNSWLLEVYDICNPALLFATRKFSNLEKFELYFATRQFLNNLEKINLYFATRKF